MEVASKPATSRKRWHTKTRSGCVQCRRRRVKCDEGRPVCRNCQRSSAECVYSPSPKETRIKCEPDAIRRSPVLPPSPSSTGPVPFDCEQLELMHLYTVTTCETMGEDVRLAKWFRETAPALLLPHDSLIGAMLSVAASHQASLRPDDSSRSLTLASRYLDQSIASLRSGIEQLSVQNGPALNLAAIFIGIAQQASLTFISYAGDADFVRNFVRVSSAVRGARTISAALQVRGMEIERRNLPPVSSIPQLAPDSKPEFDQVVADIEAEVQEHILICTSSHCDKTTHDIYEAAVEDIRAFYMSPFMSQISPPTSPSSPVSKPKQLDWSQYCRLLLVGDNMCKLFAVCYTALFHEFNQRWYVKGFFGDMVRCFAPKLMMNGGRSARIAHWALGRVSQRALSLQGEGDRSPATSTTLE